MKHSIYAGWRQVAVAFLAQLVSSGALIYAYSVVVAPLSAEFGASRTVTLLGLTTMMLVSGVLSPWLGGLVDRHSLRNMLVVGALALPAGFLALSFTTAMWQVLAVYGALFSLALPLLGPLCANTLLARWFARRRGLAMGIAAVGLSLGGLMFPPLAQWLIAECGWRMALQWLALVILAMTLPPFLLLTVDRPTAAVLATEQQGVSAGEPAAAPPEAAAILKNANFWKLAVVIGVLFSIYTALLGSLVPLMADLGMDATYGALQISVISLCAIIGKLCFGAIVDRVDPRLALAAGALLLMTGLACYLGALGTAWLSLGSVAVGLAAGGIYPVWGALVGKIFGVASYGRAMGLMAPVMLPFNLSAPLIAGVVYDAAGSYTPALILFFGALMAALGLTYLIRIGGAASHEPALKASET